MRHAVANSAAVLPSIGVQVGLLAAAHVEHVAAARAPGPRTAGRWWRPAGAATSVPSEAAISEALARRKSPARMAWRLPHRALTLSTLRRVVGLVHHVVVVERAEVDELDRDPAPHDVVGSAAGTTGSARRAGPTRRRSRPEPLAAGPDEVAGDLGEQGRRRLDRARAGRPRCGSRSAARRRGGTAAGSCRAHARN